MIEKHGELHTFNAGTELVVLLRKSKHVLEAWQLLERLVIVSTQHHGRDHKFTKVLLDSLSYSKTQSVTLRTLGLQFKVVGCEEGEYVLRGPIGVSEERMETFNVYPTDVILESDGVSVVCHGLKNKAAHFNG